MYQPVLRKHCCCKRFYCPKPGNINSASFPTTSNVTKHHTANFDKRPPSSQDSGAQTMHSAMGDEIKWSECRFLDTDLLHRSGAFSSDWFRQQTNLSNLEKLRKSTRHRIDLCQNVIENFMKKSRVCVQSRTVTGYLFPYIIGSRQYNKNITTSVKKKNAFMNDARRWA